MKRLYSQLFVLSMVSAYGSILWAGPGKNSPQEEAPTSSAGISSQPYIVIENVGPDSTASRKKTPNKYPAFMPYDLSDNSDNIIDHEGIAGGSYHLITEEWAEEEKPSRASIVEDWGIDFPMVTFPSKEGHSPTIGVTGVDGIFRDFLPICPEPTSSQSFNLKKYTPLLLAKKDSPLSRDPSLWQYTTQMMIAYSYTTEKTNRDAHQTAALLAFQEVLKSRQKLVSFVRFKNANDETDYAFLCTPDEIIERKIKELSGFENINQKYLETLPFLAKFWIASRFNPGPYTLSRETLEELIATFRRQMEKKRKHKLQELQRRTSKRTLATEKEECSEDDESAAEEQALRPFLETGYDIAFLKGRPHAYKKDIFELLNNPEQHISRSKKGKNNALTATAAPISLPPAAPCADSPVNPTPVDIMAKKASFSLPLSTLANSVLLPLSTTGSQSPLRPMATVEPFSQTTPSGHKESAEKETTNPEEQSTITSKASTSTSPSPIAPKGMAFRNFMRDTEELFKGGVSRKRKEKWLSEVTEFPNRNPEFIEGLQNFTKFVTDELIPRLKK